MTGALDRTAVVDRLLATFEEATDFLNGLDAQIGDGDHGFSMRAGMRALASFARENDDLPLGRFLGEGGRAFNDGAGSTIGILTYSAMRAAGREAGDDIGSLSLHDAAAMLDAAIAAISKRGGAQPGQKTMIDALDPAKTALDEAVAAASQPAEAAGRVAEAARAGAEATRELTSETGRAHWFKERSVGVIDPGAWSAYLIFKTIADYVSDNVRSGS